MTSAEQRRDRPASALLHSPGWKRPVMHALIVMPDDLPDVVATMRVSAWVDTA